MAVFIDGATLASLLYSHSNSAGNQEGLLLGQIVSHLKEHISDSQINNAQVQTFMCVSSHIPWPNENKVYSRGGLPIKEKLAVLLGNEHTKEEVVGWYSFRRNSTLRMSMKEHTLHKNLEAHFCPNKQDHFLFFMCGNSASSECSTHSLDHCFVTVGRETRGVKKLALSVNNLGDTLHTQYKTHVSSGLARSTTVKNILQQFRSQFASQSGEDMAEVKRIDDMSSALNKNLVTLCKQVAESEHRAGELEKEVMLLKAELRQREDVKLAEQRLLLEEKKESNLKQNHLYPQLSAVDSGMLVVNLKPPTTNDKPSVDDLLSLAGSEPGSEKGAGASALQPVITSTLDDSPPSYSASVQDDCQPANPVLQSVVDSISDTDEEENRRELARSSTLNKSSSSGVTEKALKEGSNKSLCAAESVDVSSDSSRSSKSKDHFSFVDNLLSSEGVPGQRSSGTVTVPRGATVTFSPRTTRSQAKGAFNSNRPSANKEKSKPKDVTSNTEINSKSSLSKSGDQCSGKLAKAGKSSYEQDKLNVVKEPCSKTMDDTAKNLNSQGHSDAKQLRSSCNGPESKSKLKLNPADFVEGAPRSRNQPNTTAAKKTVIKNGGDSDSETIDCVSQKTGNDSNIQKVDNVCLSSSPIF